MLLRPLLVLSGLLWAAAAAAEPIDHVALQDLGGATVARIQDDGSLMLADGRVLRLAGIDLPRGALGRETVAALSDLAGRGPLVLKGDGPPEDRYGRLVAEAFAADGIWIEGELLRRGLARVATTVDHRIAAPALYAAERGACARRAGLWADPDYALRRPDQALRLIDSWQVVDGRVQSAILRRGAADLYFGDNPARDLEVRVPAGIARRMDYDPAKLAGQRIRVRGWIGKGQGPVITLNHAEQIEVMGRAQRGDMDEP